MTGVADIGFAPCEICGSVEWRPVRTGAVRDGAFGRLSPDSAVVARCAGCSVERLSEQHCHGGDIYVSARYRELLAAGEAAREYLASHDVLQLANLKVLWPENLRGRTVVDVGCAAGSFLDHVAGLACTTVAIEPCVGYHDSLRERGHQAFSTCPEAVEAGMGDADFVFSFSVIEHVSDPLDFLLGIAHLLGTGGRALVSTPNRRDVLMDLLPADYPAFFYRTVHRWYFDVDSFQVCAQRAGLRVIEARCVHRFGLSNALRWLRDKRPGGADPLPEVPSVMERSWQASLEQAGTGDYLYFWLAKAN
ncbi:MAG: class I SAM-dependent methyltransferase [Burkholderiales bacterium]|nr:class I SAM-dependent methyltransferase [Burkholderiales bacterium]